MSGPYEIELPSVAIDAVLFDDPLGRPTLINRDPEPGESGIPVTTTIALDVTDTGGGAIDISATRVWVAGVLAFDGGAFQPGYNGPGSSYDASLDLGHTTRIVISTPAPFSSLQFVQVRVVGQSPGIDVTYAFTCEDVTPPFLINVLATGPRSVRLTFSQPVRQRSTTAADDALNPGNYLFTQRTAPSVGVVAVSVLPIASTVIEVITDIEITPGATYEVVASSLEDLSGNIVAAPFDRLEFTGFVFPSPPGRSFNLLDLLPKMNVREDDTEDLRKFIGCLQEVVTLLLFEIDRWGDIIDPDLADEQWLDLMLADLGNPFPFDLTVIDKRRLIQVLVLIYREKGTAPGIANAARFFLGLEIAFDSYNNEGAWTLGEAELGLDTILGTSDQGLLYSFTVAVQEPLTDDERMKLRQIVSFMKPAHTHFLALLEPTIPAIIDHLELGLSELGVNWTLH